jgi:hypothetical protein
MKKWQIFLGITLFFTLGFVLGIFHENDEPAETIPVRIKPEKVLISFTKIEGDSLFVSFKGDARIIWSDEHFLDKDGVIFLSQVPNANDLQFLNYPFVGNANTGKFYPSNTSWARGVKVKDRRFFLTKELAIAAGFIPSKSVE